MAFRPDPKPTPKKKKKPSRIKNKRYSTRKGLYSYEWGFHTETEMFENIWNKRKHKSFLSGKPISQPLSWNFAHVLKKAQNFFPKYRLNPNNVILLTQKEHHLLDNGSKEQIKKYEKDNNCSFEIIYKLHATLKEEYKKEYSKTK